MSTEKIIALILIGALGFLCAWLPHYVAFVIRKYRTIRQINKFYEEYKEHDRDFLGFRGKARRYTIYEKYENETRPIVLTGYDMKTAMMGYYLSLIHEYKGETFWPIALLSVKPLSHRHNEPQETQAPHEAKCTARVRQ